jgi:hypothetical protein
VSQVRFQFELIHTVAGMTVRLVVQQLVLVARLAAAAIETIASRPVKVATNA